MTASGSAALTTAEITRRSRSNFTLSFAFMNREQQRAMSAVYAFCRAVDDAVDEAPDVDSGRRDLAFWRRELEAAMHGPAPSSETGRELAYAIATFGVRGEHLHALCDGCAMDLDGARFENREELEHYCSLVASAVGLACLAVFGVGEAEAGHYADRLGRALQLTNILRDLRADARAGRCYVPSDVLHATGVDPAWLDGSGPREVYSDGGPVHELVERLTELAHARFDEARVALPDARAVRRRLLPAEIMGAVYAALLVRVEARRGRIDLPGRLRISTPHKLALAVRTWARGRRP